MRLNFFWIPALDSAAAESALNQFLAANRVVQVEKNFCAAGGHSPGWAVCVEWLPGNAALPVDTTVGTVSKVDYREVLDAPTFQIFSALRTWRKTTATTLGVPIYTVATNEHLAAISRQRIETLPELAKIDGFGAARLAKHASGLLAVSSREIAALSLNDVIPE